MIATGQYILCMSISKQFVYKKETIIILILSHMEKKRNIYTHTYYICYVYMLRVYYFREAIGNYFCNIE
jgi:hypothetical protein